MTQQIYESALARMKIIWKGGAAFYALIMEGLEYVATVTKAAYPGMQIHRFSGKDYVEDVKNLVSALMWQDILLPDQRNGMEVCWRKENG